MQTRALFFLGESKAPVRGKPTPQGGSSIEKFVAAAHAAQAAMMGLDKGQVSACNEDVGGAPVNVFDVYISDEARLKTFQLLTQHDIPDRAIKVGTSFRSGKKNRDLQASSIVLQLMRKAFDDLSKAGAAVVPEAYQKVHLAKLRGQAVAVTGDTQLCFSTSKLPEPNGAVLATKKIT